MRHCTTLVAAVVAAAIAAGCYTGGDTAVITADMVPPRGTTTDSTSVLPGPVTGLPCDVATILSRSCSSCHGAVPSGGAPNTILSYEDLVAPSMSDPSRTVAELSAARMQDAKRPMPPSGASAADAAVFAAWVADGSKKASCDTPVTGGSSYATASVCTSNGFWTSGNRGSSAMHPGVACIQCHDADEGPSYQVAGTVYPTAHEPDDCNGSSGAQVVITDATGKVFTATPNSAGNFAIGFRSAMQMPYTAKIVSGSKTRVMVGAQTDGDCNGCHTESGTQKAPGRIMAP